MAAVAGTFPLVSTVKRSVITAIVALLLAGCSAPNHSSRQQASERAQERKQAEAVSNSRHERVRAAIEGYMAAKKITGASVAVSKDGQFDFAEGFGYADFTKSPLSAEGKEAAATVVRFAKKSQDVTVVITRTVAPWIFSDKPPQFSETLLAAYIAGNIKSQLDHKTKANDSYAGVQQVLKTYAQLKEADKTLDIPEVQKLADLEAKKQLKDYLEEALKKEKTEPAK